MSVNTPLQERTQEGADGAEASPKIHRKKIIYSFKSGAFYVSLCLQLLVT